ncbi:MAG: hypothetical protein HY689_03125 [Chloroflexi bacterium]|nr:hypothetical protein [Chloroflexota bacterium]
MKALFRSAQYDQEGAVAVLVALLVPVIFGMVALVFDLSRGWENRRLLQNCSDAAALAAARELPNAVLAETMARTYLANCLETTEVLAASVDTLIDRNGDGLPDAVEVISYRTMPFTFARILGSDEGNIAARALAGTIQPDDYWGLEPFGVQVDPDPCGGGLGDYSINGVPIVLGATYTIKYAASNNDVPGNFQPLALGGRGGNVYKNNVTYGYQGWVGTCDMVTTETGNKVGPTIQGLDDRLVPPECDETTPRWSECPWVILVALVPPLPNGRDEVQVLTFAFFVVEEYQSTGNQLAEITGRLIDTTNRYLLSGEYRGEDACDPTLGLPCGLRLLE